MPARVGPERTGPLTVVRDALQRPLRDLRISVTDRCNLRCGYCMPREVFGSSYRFLAGKELLAFEEIARVARVLAGCGMRRIRLTGGEPLLRRDLPRLVEMLAAIEQVQDIALTTNGLLLARHAPALAAAGLRRVTVSLDALDGATLAAMADAPLRAERVLEGIEAATAAGLEPVKVNMVVRRGVNDHEILPMAERFRHRPQTLRFIEYMDVGSTNGWRAAEVLSAAEILSRVGERWPLEELPPTVPGEVATRYRYLDGAGEIGVIHSVSEPFCHGCTRARLAADGRLFTCLFAREGHDLRALLRGGAGDDLLTRELEGIWSRRADRYSAERALAGGGGATSEDPGAPAPKIEMSYIGG